MGGFGIFNTFGTEEQGSSLQWAIHRGRFSQRIIVLSIAEGNALPFVTS